jgi:hypothetical protein
MLGWSRRNCWRAAADRGLAKGKGGWFWGCWLAILNDMIAQFLILIRFCFDDLRIYVCSSCRELLEVVREDVK